MAKASLPAVQVDGDDFDDLLVEIEASFGVTLPRNLMRISTAGDLFDEIVKFRPPGAAGGAAGGATGRAMVLDRLRPLLAGLGLDPAASPDAALAEQRLPSPRRVAAMIRRELGLALPPRVVGGFSVFAAPAIVLGAIGLAVWLQSLWPLALWLLVYPVLALDRGGWRDDWASLDRLSAAVAARNVASLTVQGARCDADEWWDALRIMIAGSVTQESKPIADIAVIGRDTRFDFV